MQLKFQWIQIFTDGFSLSANVFLGLGSNGSEKHPPGVPDTATGAVIYPDGSEREVRAALFYSDEMSERTNFPFEYSSLSYFNRKSFMIFRTTGNEPSI